MLIVLQNGFMLNTGAKIIGPTVLFPRYAIGWNINSGKDINEGALSLFTVLEPKPDVVIIGLDDIYDFEYYRNLQTIVKKLDISAEILPVHHACTAFNFMNDEGRYIAAALIPPTTSPRFFDMLPQSESNERITDSSNTTDDELKDVKKINNVK